MLNSARETEAKFRVHQAFELPELSRPETGVSSVERHEPRELRAVYWDANDLRLAREGITLRHRSGEGYGLDGWQLKLPVSDGAVPDAGIGARDEFFAPGEPEIVPRELKDLVTPWIRSAALVPVATLITSRTNYLLRDDSNKVLMELSDDVVEVLGSGRVEGRFREIELEDRTGGTQAIERVGAVLRAAGAVGGEFVPKVIRALGSYATAPPDPPPPQPTSVGDPVRAAICMILRRNVRALLRHDIDVRQMRHDAVHQMRIDIRRIRGALRTFGPVLDISWSEALREELGWIGDRLGNARDDEVLVTRLNGELDSLPADLVVGQVREAIDEVLVARTTRSERQVGEALRSNRYVLLLDRLVAAAIDPHLLENGDEPIATTVPKLLVGPYEKLHDNIRELSKRHEVDAKKWHRARIHAKQLRYACESVSDIFGKRARRLAADAETLQGILGEHQDAVMAAELLRRIAGSKGAGPGAFTLGVMHARQRDLAEAAQKQFWSTYKAKPIAKHAKWLTK